MHKKSDMNTRQKDYLCSQIQEPKTLMNKTKLYAVAFLLAFIPITTNAQKYDSDFDGTGNTSNLARAIENGESFLEENAKDYPYDAVQTYKDLIRGAKCVLASGPNQSIADKWYAKLAQNLAKLRNAKGYKYIAPAENDDYRADRGFVHPGCINSKEEIDRVKALIAAKDSVTLRAMDGLRDNGWASSSITPNASEEIVRGGSGSQNYINAARQAHSAYLNALRWQLTGNTKNADCAVNILNAWAHTCKRIGGDSNYALASGIYGYEFANAAELLRSYEGWSSDDFKAYQQWMLDVWYPSAMGFLRGRNGTWENTGKWWQAPGHYWSNWGLCNVLCVLSIGVLCDDPFIYNQALSFYKYDQCGTFENMSPEQVASGNGYVWSWGLTEFLGNLIPIESSTPDSLESTPWGKMSQMQESGRDQGHCTLSIGFAVDICQTAFNQGDDLFAYMDNRLAGGIEHMAAYNYAGKDNLPFVKYIRQSNGFTVADGRGGIMTGDSPSSRGLLRPYWDRILAYYEGRKGIRMPYSEIARDKLGIDGGCGGSTSGGYDHLGFSTLMCRRQMVSADSAIITLIPKITYNDSIYEHNELGGLTNTFATNTHTGVPVGSVIGLTALLPDDVEDSGNWLWNTGEKGNSITVTANESRMYRVTYTARNGVKSHQSFTIAVDGDCQPIAVTSTAETTGSTISVDNRDSLGQSPFTTEVFYGDPLTLRIASRNSWCDHYWSDASTADSTLIPAVTSDRTIEGVYISQGGRRQKCLFAAKVKYIRPDILANNSIHEGITTIIVNKGDSVSLTPYVPLLIRKLMKYSWDEGNDTTRTLKLGSMEQSETHTLTVSFDDHTESFTFRIIVKADEADIPAGNYTIRYTVNDTYLTWQGKGEAATFEPYSGELSQVWYMTANSISRYKIITLADSTALNVAGKTVRSAGYIFKFDQAEGTRLFAIHTSTPRYMTVTADSLVEMVEMSSPTDMPFEIMPYESAGIMSAECERTESGDIFNISGQKVDGNYKGIVIRKNRKYYQR